MPGPLLLYGCWLTLYAPLGAFVVHHPTVTAFCADHGFDLVSRSIFEVPFVWNPDVVARDDDGMRLDIGLGDETLHLALDGQTRIRDTEVAGR